MVLVAVPPFGPIVGTTSVAAGASSSTLMTPDCNANGSNVCEGVTVKPAVTPAAGAPIWKKKSSTNGSALSFVSFRNMYNYVIRASAIAPLAAGEAGA